MSSYLRAELAALVAAYDEHGGYRPTPAAVNAMFAAMKRARAVLAAALSDGPAVTEEGREPAAVEGEFSPTVLAAPTPPVDPDALAARPLLEAVAQMGDCGQHTMGRIMALSKRAASWLNENPPGQPVAIEPRGCPTPGACSCVQPVTPTPSLAELVNPQPGYQPGTRLKAGAQLVQGANGPDWWAPEFGSDSLDTTLEAIRDRIAPYLREPVAGVDVPGPDGDYGGLVELCRAEGVGPQMGVPLLQRARKAWDVGTALPADGEAEQLAQWLYRLADERTCNRRRGIRPHPSALTRAAVLLQRYSAARQEETTND